VVKLKLRNFIFWKFPLRSLQFAGYASALILNADRGPPTSGNAIAPNRKGIEIMDDTQLERSLQGIGKACFVNHYQIFHYKSRTDPSSLVNYLMEAGISNEAGAKIRVGYARGIFDAGRGNDALNIISKSTGVPREIREKARLLLNDGTVSPPPPPPAPIPVINGILAIDTAILDYVHNAAASELLTLHAMILDELRERGIVRSANGPGGDYAELLFIEAFGWTRAKNSVAGYDATDPANVRYQVKSRRIHHPTTSRQLSALRNFSDAAFDFLAAVLFNKDYSVMRAAIIPYNVIQPRFSKHTNSSIFYLEDLIWNLPGVRDVTQELRCAATKLDGRR
jgi:hypothetical protein